MADSPSLSGTGYYRDEAEKPSHDREQEILKVAHKRFDRAIEWESRNRADALDDLRFKAGDQWDSATRSRREQQLRPCITVNKLPTFVHQITNDQRQNRPAINISPIGDRASKKTAQMIKGLIREIERQSDADIAYDTAFDNEVSNGFGYWRLLTEYEQWRQGEAFNNQVIRVVCVRNPFTTYLDPDRDHQKGRGPKWGFITELMPKEDFESEHPDADHNWEDIGIGDNYTTWYTDTHVRIAEYFVIEVEKRTLVALRNGHVGYFDDLDPSIKQKILDDPTFMLDKREADVPKVCWYKLTGKEVLESRVLPGSEIPIIECVGDEIDIEGRVIKSGVIRNMKGPQMMYNFSATANIEVTALQPKAPFIMAAGQDEGYEDEWNTANIESYSRLRYKATSVDGHLVPIPQRQPPAAAPAGWIELQQSAAQDMMGVSGIRFDSTLQERTQDESGIALERLAAHQQVGSFHYIDNYARALKQSGRIMVEWLAEIMDTRRQVTILTDDNSERHVILDPNAPQSFQMENINGHPVEVYNLTLGKYEVAVTIGPSYQTRRQESSRGMMDFLKFMPPTQAPLVTDLIAQEQDWEGSDEFARRLAMTLPPGMLEPDISDLSPQTVALIRGQQQQLQQAQQMLQQMQAALEEKKTDQALEQDKINKDFEAKLLSIQEKGNANLITHFREIALEVARMQHESEKTEGEADE